MSDFVETMNELQKNISTFNIQLNNNADDFSCKTTREVLKGGRKFLVLKNGDEFIFCPIRYAAYKNMTAKEYDRRLREGNPGPGNDLLNGNKAEQAIKKLFNERNGFFKQSNNLDHIYTKVCHRYDLTPTKHPKSYYIIHPLNNNGQKSYNSVDYQDNIEDPDSVLIEGSLLRITVNRYERDPVARQKCIEHYGTACVVCGFDFEERYGAIGAGFVHVHHLVDIASIGERYQVDPVRDLRPVCPNCHAMLHQKRPAMSVDKLKKFFLKKESEPFRGGRH